MELNNLLNKIRNQEEEPKTFLALEITEDIVQAAVWHVKNARTEVVQIGTQVYWNGSTDEEKLLTAVDTTLAKATEGLSQEPDEIVFGLPHNWVKDNDIVKGKKEIIKTICKGLDLQPLGYVVLMESLIRYLKIREGTPATAVIVHVTDSEVTLSLVKLGRVVGTHIVGRSEDIANDVEEGISRFKSQDHLPSRIIVFDGSHDMEEIVQNLTSYDWQNKFNFLHLPKIEALPKDAGISAIAVAGGSEVAQSIGFEIDFEEKPTSQTPAPEPSSVPKKEPSSDLESLGFVKNKDIKKIKTAPKEEVETNVPETAVPDGKSPTPKPQQPKTKSPSFAPTLLSNLKGIKLPSLSFSFFSKVPKVPLLLGSIVIIALISILVSVLWIIPKTEVTVFIEPKNLEESLDLTISERVSSPDLENNIIPASVVTKAVSGDETKDATGTRIIGDPASGEVTIYNRTEIERTFSSGTVISSSGLDFTLDSDVTIASGSADNDYVGKANVSVTAEQIGEESNLPSDTEFTIDDYSTSSYVARNSSPLSGGSSSEIRVVSEDDLDALLSSLTSKLEEQAKSELVNSANDQTGVFIQDDLTEIVSEDYSADAGDEQSTVTLSLEIEARGLAYNSKDIEQLITGNINDSIPTGYRRADQPIEVDPKSETPQDDEVILEAVVKVKLLPEIDESALKNRLKGKKPSEVEEILKSIPGFQKAALSIQPKWLPPRWKTVSRNPNKISIEISSQ